jgi:hypothetical protein
MTLTSIFLSQAAAALRALPLFALPSLASVHWKERDSTTIPAGTELVVRLLSTLSTRTQRAGARFESVLIDDLRSDAQVVARAGTPVYGTITRCSGGTRVRDHHLAATLTGMYIGGRFLPIVTDTAGVRGEAGGGLASIGTGVLLGAVMDGGYEATVRTAARPLVLMGRERHILVPAGAVADMHLRVPLVMQ